MPAVKKVAGGQQIGCGVMVGSGVEGEGGAAVRWGGC